MKKLQLFILLFLLGSSLYAADFTGVKIYINPGHGGYNGANDRNLITINYELNDTLGFWESWSNLQKGLALRDLLQANNATVFMSRTQNRDEDDRVLSEIAEEANANNVDAFLSIHSNALGTNTGTNYLLLLYHGYDNAPTVTASLPMATACWPRLISNQLTVWTNYATSTNIRGDYSFYGNTSGLGVLRPLTVPGFLSEGSFHDYQPETHRLLNKDYRRLEANNFYRYFCDYFQKSLPSTGIIAGFVKGKDETIVNARYSYKTGTQDRWLPLNGAKIKLMSNAGDSINNYQVDSMYNGIFAFYNLNPGTYKLRITAKDHTTKDTTVTVTAATTTYAKMMLVNSNIVIPKDTTPDYPVPAQEAGVVALNEYNFNSATPVTPDWLNTTQIKKAVYRNEKLYILTAEPKILIVNATTNALIREMNMTGISGGVSTLNDIAFTSDGYLLGCNKDTVSLPAKEGRYFKVYTWDNDSVAPKTLFQTQSQANWSNGILGETFAVSGPRWRCYIYTPSITTGSTKAIRIIGYAYEDSITLGYKYMMDATNYTEALWGKKIKFTTSPGGFDHFYLDSEKVLPTEFRFDWGQPDRSPLVNKGTFTEKSGYQLEPTASGINFFRHAKHVFMASPVCQADSTLAGVALFDITEGINNAVKVSKKLPETGLGSTKATYLASAAKVSGYDIDLMILAQNQGLARYKTTSNTKANIYASKFNVVMPNCNCPNTFGFEFVLNENATDVKVLILDGDSIVKTIECGALNKGVNTVTGDLKLLPKDDYNWAVTATSDPIDRPAKISDNTNPLMQFFYPRSVSVDNNPESRNFGNIYVSESAAGTLPGRATQDGIYMLNAALQDFSNQGATPYAGGVSWITNSNSSPMRLSAGEDGNVYICDWSDAHPGVWKMDPSNPTAAFKPVFDGLTKQTSGLSTFNNVNIHGSISHCYSTGTGENTKLYTFDEDYIDAVATNSGNLLQYNIGTLASPVQTAPSIVYNDGLYGNLQQNKNSCIAPDARGGWWISQYRAADTDLIPSLIHVNASGVVDFNSGKTPTLIENSYTAGLAVTTDGKKLAMGCNNEVKIFDVTFSEAGVPTLTRLHSIKPAMGANTQGIAFDIAGNVYVVSEGDKRLGIWALPKANNTSTTRSSIAVHLVIVDGLNDIQNPADYVSVFPNPVNDIVNIQCKGFGMESYQLFDLNGQLISGEKQTSDFVSISTTDLTPGMYILKIRTSAGLVVKRIIKK